MKLHLCYCVKTEGLPTTSEKRLLVQAGWTLSSMKKPTHAHTTLCPLEFQLIIRLSIIILDYAIIYIAIFDNSAICDIGQIV